MKTELIPAVTAAVGGSALLGGIVAAEARQARMMRASRLPFSLTFPLATDAATAKRALVALSGLSAANEIIAEVVGCGEQIVHRLWIPEAVAAAVCAQLRAAIPGLRIEQAQAEEARPPALKLAISVPRQLVLRADDPVGASRGLLAALLPLGNERITVRWALRPGRPDSPTEEPDRAWEAKTSGQGLFVAGVVLVQADGRNRARALAARLTAVLRARRGSGGGLDISPGGRLMPRASRRSGWLAIDELVMVVGWPVIGSDSIAGVQHAARQVPPSQALARHGRPLLIADDHGTRRPVALSAETARRHVLLLGSTNSGKSAVLGRGIVADIAAGYGGVVLDPKGDLVRDVLDRIPAEHAERICVIDPSDPGPIAAVDLFGGGDASVRSDVILTVLRSLSLGWGPRLDSYLDLGLRSLSATPGASLLDLPRLYLAPDYRQSIIAQLHDPILLGRWQLVNQLSEAALTEQIQAPLTRIWSLLARPAVRDVLAQPNPRLDVARLLAERKWLLVSLPAGVIGAPAARLIASSLTFVIWGAIAARAAIAPEWRHHLSLYFDETQALSDQGLSIESMLEQARGYGASVTAATQAAGRLPEQMRHALLSNVGTLITFRTGAAEAAAVAREMPGLDARNLLSLGEFEVAARVAVGRGSASSVVTGRTEPLPPVVGQADLIRQRSAERYGRDRAEVEAAIAERYGLQPTPEPEAEIGRLRRQS